MTGKTVDEAVDAACAALERSRDEISYEVIDMPQKKLFGSIPAKVRVYVNEDAFSVKDLLMSDERATDEKQPAKTEAGGEAKREKKAQKDRQPKPARAPESETKTEPEARAAAPGARAEAPVIKPEIVVEEIEIPESELPAPAAAALQYLREIAERMQATDLTYRAVTIENGVKFIVDGEDAAALIGRRGEVMDALQYLCLLVSNRSEGDYCKISLDVANYRAKREKTLEALAKRMAGKVLKNRRSQTLEPMNPYERRIVHSAIQEIEGVKSESVGEEPHRRVVVLMEGDTVRPNQGRGGRDNRGGGNRSGGGQRNSSGRGGHDNRGPRRDSGRGGPPRNNRDRELTERDYEEPKLTETPPGKNTKPQDPELEKNLYGKIEL